MLEAARGRQFTREELARLRAIKEALHLRNDDAVWALFIALEHNRTFYEKLPRQIEASTSTMLSQVQKTADDYAKAAQNSLAKRTIEELEYQMNKIHLHRLVPIYLLILISMMILASSTFWAGYCIGTGRTIPLISILEVPMGAVIKPFVLSCIFFCSGIIMWNGKNIKESIFPFFIIIILVSFIFFIKKYL